MSFQDELTIGADHVMPGQLKSVRCQSSGLYIDSQLGVFGITGDGLDHLFIELVHRDCREIVPSAGKPASIFGWTATAAGIMPRQPKAAGLIDPYGGCYFRGWMLFETPRFWHLFPSDHLRVFGYRSSWLYFVFADKVARVEATPGIVMNAFYQLKSNPYRRRHYTARSSDEYLFASPGLRDWFRDIEIKDLGSGGISDLRLTNYYPLNPGSGMAPSTKRPSFSISGP